MNPNGTHIEAPSVDDLGPEQALLNSFKSAATAVTQMYKDAMKQNRKSYHSGYEQCLQDLIGYISSHNSVQAQRERGEIQLRNSYIPASDLMAFTREKYSQVHAEATSPENLHNPRESQPTHEYQGVQPGVERHVPITPTLPVDHQFNFIPPTITVNPFQGVEFEGLPENEFATSFESDSMKRRLSSSPDRNLISRDMNAEYMFEPPYKRTRSRHEGTI
ncbi:hypothetical protein K7432_009019 [Basidiobolus ranarum]|uniref:Uncharacterized protein n=1 Tax=Basidiobolus ranarum TaxID=34480 RepID=A0ABR2VXP7_9FUNG